MRPFATPSGISKRLLITLPILLHGCDSNFDEFQERIDRFNARPHITAAPELRSCAELVDEYVRSKRNWAEADYKISVEEYASTDTIIRVSHIDDWNQKVPSVGGGTSFFVEVDCDANLVLRELMML